MIGATLCSGIGAPEMAALWVDWRLASEIEKFPRAVLQERFAYTTPDDHNQGDPLLWGDMTEIHPDLLRRHGVPLPDLLVAGTPCQAFSVAGLRKGTEDPRGNLTLAFVDICHELVAARHDGKLAVLWENVPGVLSDKGNAFGAFLGGLVGAMDALPQPSGGNWPGEGMVEGPRARAAWAVLDAQWFGVAQRRRRVFVVVDFGNCVDPAAVLFERQSVRGNSPPRRKQGKDVAPTIASRPTGGGGLGTDFDLDGGLIPSTGEWPAEVAPTLNAHFGDKMGLEDQHALNGAGLFVPSCATGDTTHALTGEGFDASEDGTCQTIGAHQAPAIAFDLNQITSKINRSKPKPGLCHTIPATTVPPHLATPYAVRRLTPTECERLQGFPDGFTEIPWRGKAQTPDGPRYKALGNSMAVPVVRWIMDRMRISMERRA